MNIREERQKEAVEAYLHHPDGKTIINACPRFGKIKVAIDIIDAIGVSHVLVVAPRKDIFTGWHSDLKKFGSDVIVEYCTFASLKKLKSPAPWGLVIIDEPHELSLNQQEFLKPIVTMFPTLGLTGTLTNKTRNELYNSLTLDTCYYYGIDDGVADGILADYTITIHQTPLAGQEKAIFNKYKYALSKASGSQKWFISLRMINFLQKSETKRQKTLELIEESKDERILVFCGVTEVADNLGIHVYHSKAKEKQILLDFCGGMGGIDQLATIKMMQAGITITPINKGIINYMSGNPEDSAQKICRFLGYEYGNPDKKASIHIISTDEEFETSRMKTGLAFFDPSKITIKN